MLKKAGVINTSGVYTNSEIKGLGGGTGRCEVINVMQVNKPRQHVQHTSRRLTPCMAAEGV